MKETGIKAQVINEIQELAKKYGVKQAPTLVVTDGEHFEKYAGAGAIKQYAVHAAQ